MVLILSVLAVTALPRFFDSSDYAPNTYQARLISTLRNIQMRALSDTRIFSGQNYPCFRVNFDNINESFGPPPLTYIDDGATPDNEIEDTCNVSIDTSSNPEYLYALSAELQGDDVDMEARNSEGSSITYIEFNGQGLPFLNSGDGTCTTSPGGCEIRFCSGTCSGTGNTVAYVCIQSQGYIHAGECVDES